MDFSRAEGPLWKHFRKFPAETKGKTPPPGLMKLVLTVLVCGLGAAGAGT